MVNLVDPGVQKGTLWKSNSRGRTFRSPNTYFRTVSLEKGGGRHTDFFNGISLKTKVTMPRCLLYLVFCRNRTGYLSLNHDHSNFRGLPYLRSLCLWLLLRWYQLEQISWDCICCFSLLISNMAPRMVCQRLNSPQNLCACTFAFYRVNHSSRFLEVDYNVFSLSLSLRARQASQSLRSHCTQNVFLSGKRPHIQTEDGPSEIEQEFSSDWIYCYIDG